MAHAVAGVSAFVMPEICETLYPQRGDTYYLNQGRVRSCSAAEPQSRFTTDTTAVLRAAEIDAQGPC